MEKVIVIDGRSVSFKSSASFLLRYKMAFGAEALNDINTLHTNFSKGTFDVETIYRLIWALAKTADKSIPDLVTWVDLFDKFPILDIFQELEPLIEETVKTTVTLKNQ